MSLRTSDVVPIFEARARLTELAEEVVGAGAEKVLTKNGSSFVTIVDASSLITTMPWKRSTRVWCCWAKPRRVCGKSLPDSGYRRRNCCWPRRTNDFAKKGKR